MRIAIVHDELMRRGGAEQVVRCFHKAFPDAPIYTLAYQPELTYPDFQECDVKTSWFQKIARNEKTLKKLFFPLGIWAMKQVDLREFDVILISSTYCAKYVKISPHALVITYCYTPFRLAWQPESYNEYVRAKGFKKVLYDMVVNILKKIDYKAAQRTDYYLAMTNETKERIVKAYNHHKEIKIIKPPVNIDRFYLSNKSKDYYLVVSRLEYYKKVSLVVDAFNELGYPLIIVGNGSLKNELEKKSKKNICFKSGLSNEAVADLYSNCKAFIFPQHEDYGITPLEANASGRPVIAYSKGGILDTMIPYKVDASKATAVFFESQNIESLKTAVKKFEKLTFNPEYIRKHAEKFNEEEFILQIKNFVLEKYQKRKLKGLIAA